METTCRELHLDQLLRISNETLKHKHGKHSVTIISLLNICITCQHLLRAAVIHCISVIKDLDLDSVDVGNKIPDAELSGRTRHSCSALSASGGVMTHAAT